MNNLNLKNVSLEEMINEIIFRGFSITLAPISSQSYVDNKSVRYDSIIQVENHIRSGNTLGGKARAFTWYISDSVLIIDRTDAGIRDVFPLEELLRLVENLQNTFGTDYFPLANNLQKLANGDEKRGLGKLIYEMTGNVTKAQSASQLVVILKECGILEWNGLKKGMEMRLTNIPNDLNQLQEYLRKPMR